MRRTALLISLLLFSAAAFASSSGGHGGEHAGPATFEAFLRAILPSWITFGAYVIGLFLILRKPFLKMWQERRGSIVAQLASADQILKAAEKALADARKRLGGIEEDVRTLRAEVEIEGEMEAQKALTDARARADLLKRQAKDLIAAEQQSELRRLREALIDKALGLAREQLRQQIKPETDRGLRDSVVSSVDQLGA